MKKSIFSILIALLSVSAIAQAQSQAKTVLDRTAETFRKAGGVEATFQLKTLSGSTTTSTENGSIQLKGEKFVLKAADVITWFDGTTQWSYSQKNEEVNVSNPTQEELQLINPYSFLYLYQNGFTYRLGSVKTFQGKQIWEVCLMAKDKQQDLQSITLYVTKDAYQPLCIRISQRGQKEQSEIVVTGYKTQQRYADSLFRFNKKQYPQAEIVDLR